MNKLHQLLHQLRLSGLRETLSVRLQEAAANRLAPEEFLTLVLQDEVNVRQQRQIQRRVKVTDSNRLKPLDEFDWRFNPSISRKQIYELAAGHFIRAKSDVLFIGPPVARTIEHDRAQPDAFHQRALRAEPNTQFRERLRSLPARHHSSGSRIAASPSGNSATSRPFRRTTVRSRLAAAPELINRHNAFGPLHFVDPSFPYTTPDT